MHGENRNAPNSPDSSLTIQDDRGYLRFQVFISRQNLGWLGNSKIPNHLDFPSIQKPGFTVPTLRAVKFIACKCYKQQN